MLELGDVAPFLLRLERDTSLKVEKLAWMIYGGKEIYERQTKLRDIVHKQPKLSNEMLIYQNHTQRYESGIKKASELIKFFLKQGISDYDEQMWVYSCLGEALPIDVHFSMFIPTIQNQMSDEQQERWLPLARSFKILGAYAQTELGHGSNVQGLETTAVYVKATDEFIIHSPTLTSRKWWPGGLGKTATHAIVHAKLSIGPKSFGLQAFIVQIRDLTSHEALPGIELGDLGPKIGFNSVDNGYCSFNHVRIPRENMLMRFSKVTSDGQFIKPLSDKLLYFTMVRVRSKIIWKAGYVLAMGCTIATRYSIVRLQGNLQKPKTLTTSGGKFIVLQERQVLDYQGQQIKLFPLLAFSFAAVFAGIKIKNMFEAVSNQIGIGNIAQLGELHATSSGLKALCATVSSDGVEICRRICGGNGYLQSSGLPHLFMESVGACTYEGTSDVLNLQTAKYLLKTFQKSKAEDALNTSFNLLESENTRYLLHSNAILLSKCPSTTFEEFHSHQRQVQCFEYRAVRKVSYAWQKISELCEDGCSKIDAMNLRMCDLIEASTAHSQLILIKSFWETVRCIENIELRNIMEELASFFALNLMDSHIGDFRESDYLSESQSRLVHELWISKLPIVRKHCVMLTDVWGFSDKTLNSTIGRYDGDVYRALVRATQREPLNENDVTQSFLRYMQPIMHIKSHL